MIVFFAHGGSDNHGCEAILRGTRELMPDADALLFSGNLKADMRYHIDDILKIRSDSYKYYNNPFMWMYYKKIKKGVLFPLIDGSVKGSYFSVGGDNYCYPSLARQVAKVDDRIRAGGNSTVLWGASIDEEAMNDSVILKDLSAHKLIVARESLTMDLLNKYGLSDISIQMPDSAFAMKPVKTELPEIFSSPVIGLNLSPMVLDYSKNAEAVKAAYQQMIEHIIGETNCNIALIPHVVKRNMNNNDMAAINTIYETVSDKNRVAVIPDMSADRLKYVISKCEFFVGARTHSTIAAYSTYVPTLVVGYSIKAHGIACDLFGTDTDYVVDCRSMNNPQKLFEAFEALYDKRESVKNHLKTTLPQYLGQYDAALLSVKQRGLL